MFMARGEKLTEEDGLPRNGVPDGRYVLWPRGEGWDVRYLVVGGGSRDWVAIADQLFPDEDSAWQAAFDYQCELTSGSR
ncbi:hypothetical protein [Erwinia sp. JH02]|uniref:hypothetical protein n=1 Tax=Erwinia sp. JH02 TaxID=2733394 RepID=UPI00148841E4|nr:hypothetical protein [Erwinia sp. JH02]NNS05981.1 hypothetical protein [Erwinia sp. JH02]